MMILYNNAVEQKTFFSVIIPTFNRAAFFKKAVESVLIQTYDNFELIVLDDGSTDNTSEIIKSYTDNRLIYLHQRNRGVSHARNKGLAVASGDHIAFLDSDDWWTGDKLEKTAEYIKHFPDIAIFHTEETWYRGGKRLNQLKKHRKPSGNVYLNALPLCCISISTAVINRKVFEQVGAFDETLEACEDYDFWLRATIKYKVMLIPEYLTEKDGGRPDQLSSRIWGLDRFRIKALEKMLLSGSLDDNYYTATLDELEKKCRIFSLGAEKRGNVDVAEYYRKLPERYRCK